MPAVTPKQGVYIRRLSGKVQALLARREDGWRSRVEAFECPNLLAAFHRQSLRVDMTRLPLSACEAAQAASVRLHGTEGEAHARLKLAALNWMRQEAATDAAAEVHLPGWIADAFSDRHHWVVECGNTDASRLLEAIRWRRAPRFTVIPFQRSHWRGGAVRRLIAVDFYWRPSLRQWLERRELAALQRGADALDLDDLLTPA